MKDIAMIACENSGHDVNDHFPEVRKLITAASEGFERFSGPFSKRA